MYLQVLGLGLMLLTLAMLYIVFTDKALRLVKTGERARLVVDPPWMRTLGIVVYAIALFLSLGLPHLGIRGLVGLSVVLLPAAAGTLCFLMARYGSRA
ncbi:MAG TPA: hypothetical protein VEB18_00060 [Candidatus Paceibacterota bacterium]|nr:hypothetical protein [Candidatus Paceibacterota bacterium]